MDQKSIERRNFMVSVMAGTAFLLAPNTSSTETVSPEKPNILWITSEDNSPLLGCYGDTFASTPNLDKLASESTVYDNAFANAPVCSPARFTILTGMNACTMGTHHMRSRYALPEFVKPYPYYLRRAGYYCTNPGKTDYNYKTEDRSHWDKGSYKNRKPGQPFFHIENITLSHESCIHKMKSVTNHEPEEVFLPPYHPDTPEIRQNWALYYDKIEEMDKKVGSILDRLKRDGLYSNTIVFYYADHGGVLCRSKRFLYDTGTRVPMIIRFPEKYRHLAPGKPGTRSNRIVSFVDLAPTLLSLAGNDIPGYMEGEAFLGDRQKPPRKYVHLFRGRMDERYDMMRAVHDGKYRYIRNYMPHRIYGQHLEYLWRAAATRSWEKEYREGRCNKVQSIFWQAKSPEELYDTESDPWEVNNLADDPHHRNVLERLRGEIIRWTRKIKDPGFIPEGEMTDRSTGTTNFDLVRRKRFPIERIIETAEMASLGDIKNLPELINRLNDRENCVRYWAATGCLILGKKAKSAVSALKKLLIDDSGDVRIAASEALCSIKENDNAIPVLAAQLRNKNPMIALHAANALDALGQLALRALPEMDDVERTSSDKYIKRALAWTVNNLKNN